MLVLSRKAGESIRIGDHITVSVVEKRGGKVLLGIDAPPDVSILRGELADWQNQWEDDFTNSEKQLETAFA
ncbi:MAG: hypothetical protein Tsb009_19300 [Planctomycetaceae bacterium]